MAAIMPKAGRAVSASRRHTYFHFVIYSGARSL